MGSIVLASLLTAAWLLVLLVTLVVLVVVGVVFVRFLLVATVAATIWAERNGADPRSYWWPFRQGPAREPHARPRTVAGLFGRPEQGRPAQGRPEASRPDPVRPDPVRPEAGRPPAAASEAPRPTRSESVGQEHGRYGQEPGPDPRLAAGPRPRTEGGPLAGLRSRISPPPPARQHPAPAIPATEAPGRQTAAEPPRDWVESQPSRPEPPASPDEAAMRQAPRRPAARTRPAPPPEDDPDERESAIDRLFAPLAESDHTEPIPAVRPRTPRQPRP